MKFIRIILALILSLSVMYIARTNSKGRPDNFEKTENGYTIKYESVPKGFENSTVTIPVLIPGGLKESDRIYFLHSNGIDFPSDQLEKYRSHPMEKDSLENEKFSIEMMTSDKGGRFYYYFEIADSSGASLLTMTDKNNEAFVFRYIGHVPTVVLISHLFLIFGTAFCISLSAINSVDLIRGASDNAKTVAGFLFFSVVFFFFGGYPIGMAMNYFAFDGFWEGIPFGTDATDNKSQMLFIYIVFAWLSMRGSLTGKPGKDFYSPVTSGWLGLGAFVLMCLIYLIPHSIQFSKELTNTVCYSYTAIFIILYLIGFKKTRA